ncbi:MAG: glycosyltransferase, partial [Thaumarchaeota archaeon]|nr:glycosyltransferase [Nitrososphaerota archaeon]
GSTDNTNQVLEKYSDRIKIITKENGGTANAENYGLKASSGKWILFLGDDDLLYSDAIENLIAPTLPSIKSSETTNLISIIDPDNTIIYSKYEMVDRYGNSLPYPTPNQNYNSLSNFEKNVILLDDNFISPIAALLPRSALDRCGLLDEEIKTLEDYEYFLRCCLLCNYEIYFVPKLTSKYRIHGSQVTANRELLARTASEIRNKILAQLEPCMREQYLDALGKYKKKSQSSIYSPIIRLRRKIRDIILAILPIKIQKKLIQQYLHLRKIEYTHGYYTKKGIDENNN